MKLSRTGTAQQRREALETTLIELTTMVHALEEIQDRDDEARWHGETLILPPERMEALLTAVANLDFEVAALVKATTPNKKEKS